MGPPQLRRVMLQLRSPRTLLPLKLPKLLLKIPLLLLELRLLLLQLRMPLQLKLLPKPAQHALESQMVEIWDNTSLKAVALEKVVGSSAELMDINIKCQDLHTTNQRRELKKLLKLLPDQFQLLQLKTIPLQLRRLMLQLRSPRTLLLLKLPKLLLKIPLLLLELRLLPPQLRMPPLQLRLLLQLSDESNCLENRCFEFNNNH